MITIHDLAPEKTVLVIAHRLAMPQDCDGIVELGDGKSKQVGKS